MKAVLGGGQGQTMALTLAIYFLIFYLLIAQLCHKYDVSKYIFIYIVVSFLLVKRFLRCSLPVNKVRQVYIVELSCFLTLFQNWFNLFPSRKNPSRVFPRGAPFGCSGAALWATMCGPAAHAYYPLVKVFPKIHIA